MASKFENKKAEPEYVFIVYGPSGSGKSATGNTLLGRELFMESETRKCVAAEAIKGRRHDKVIRVIDTKAIPDYSADTGGILEANSEVTRSLLLYPKGPRNIVLVVKKDQQPKQVAGCLQFLRIMLGKEALEDLIVIFAGTSEINGAEFKDFVNELDKFPDEKTILSRCKHRFAFNDGDTKKTNEQKVDDILEIAKKTDKDHNEVQLVMIGESLAGKTKAANNILGEIIFEFGKKTRDCLAAGRKVNGSDVMIADTPGFFSKTRESDDSLIEELKDPVCNLSAKSTVFVLVMRMDRHEMTAHEKEIITIIQDQFHDKIARKLIIIFTWEDEYIKKGKSVEEFLRSAPTELKRLLKQCHYRCVGFNNMADRNSAENAKQVSILLKLVNEADVEDSQLRLVLIGRTGMGKSSTGNTIIGEPDVFEHKMGTNSTTERCQKEEREINGRELLIVDTPGLFDTRVDITVTLLEMAKCLTMTMPGPHVFVLVLDIMEKFTRESQECIRMIRKTFGEEVFSHTLVVFTKTDIGLMGGKLKIEEVIESSAPGIRDILKQNNNRWLAFNNQNPTGNEPEELIEVVDIMLACSEGRHYTSTIYKKIATRLKAYGAGSFAEMRGMVDTHPWALFHVVWILAFVGIFSFGWVYGILYCAMLLLTLMYESVMGRRVKQHHA